MLNVSRPPNDTMGSGDFMMPLVSIASINYFRAKVRVRVRVRVIVNCYQDCL